MKSLLEPIQHGAVWNVKRKNESVQDADANIRENGRDRAWDT
jgi:hypothetical protein